MRRSLLLLSVTGFLMFGIAILIISIRESTDEKELRVADIASEQKAQSSEDSIPSEREIELSLQDREKWLQLTDPEKGKEWVLRELNEAEDYSTGAEIALGLDHRLGSWSSYRVFLLDMLYRLDPAAAAEVSRAWVERSDSADEWAVALRNVAAADESGQDREWLRQRTEELLAKTDWQANPSAGYLNAFDVIVHIDHTEVSPELLALCANKEQAGVRNAAFLALNRLVQRNPQELLSLLVQTANNRPENSLMISNMIAHADVRDELQREAVEAYLISEDRSEREIRGFANVFPNAIFQVSSNLLTENYYLTGEELAMRDRATLAVVRQWVEDSRFSKIRPLIEMIESRLESFVES